jgi:uncharacterized protein YggL (DUF469 family)
MLRADLEKVRLLTEMVRRREKEKLRIAQFRQLYFKMTAFPLQTLMHAVIDLLAK